MEKHEIIVQPFTWDIVDDYGDDGVIQVQAWCFDRNNKPYLIRIEDYQATCYVQLPTQIEGKNINWFDRDIDEFMNSLTKKLLPNEKYKDVSPPVDHTFVHRPLLYFFNSAKYPMIHLTFSTIKAMRACARLLSRPFYFKGKGEGKVEVWEHQIPYLRKLWTQINLEPSQWFKTEAVKVAKEDKISRLDNEYLIPFSKIVSLSNKETSSWRVNPKFFVFDIEVYSKNHQAFPDKFNASDVCYMISVITQRYNLPATRKRQCILLGDCRDVPGAEIIKVKTELDCINTFSDIVLAEDPDIISGYNHHGFDNDYMNTRLERIMEEWREMGRLIGSKSVMESMSWASSAYGYNEVSIIKMSGRISIDLLPVVRRDYKLPKYSLDVVGNFFLGRGKHPVKPQDIFAAYKEQTDSIKEYTNDPSEANKKRYDLALDAMTRIVKYCIEDAEITLDIAEKIHIWIASIELSNIVGVTVMDLYNRGQQIRCLSKIYDEAHRQGYVLDFHEPLNVIFNGGAVEKPQPGVTDECAFYDVNSMYPSIVIANNICYSTFVPDHLSHTVDDKDCYIVEFDQIERPKKKTDKSSDEDFDIDAEIVEEDEAKLVHRKLRFVKQHLRQGIVPKIVKYLVDERKRVKAEIKDLEARKKKGEVIDDVMFVVLDRRQNGLKVTSNSFFGFFGAYIGRLPLIEAAMAITAEGRRIASELKKYLRDKYDANIIYGDTDSVVPKFNHLGDMQWKEKYAFWKQVEHELSSMFPGITLEMEKVTRIINFAPKMYAYLLYSKDGVLDNDPKKVQAKGIVLARRDGTPWVRKHYRDILFNILSKYSNNFEKECESMFSSFSMIINTSLELLDNRVNWEDLAKINEISSKAKSPTAALSEHLRQIGRPAQVGDRIQYLICDIPEVENIGGRMRSIDEYLESQDTPDPIKLDVTYYLENALLKKIDPLWQVGYGHIIELLTDQGYKPNSLKHFVGISDPVKMIARVIGDGHDQKFIMDLKDWLKSNLDRITKKSKTAKKKIIIKSNIRPIENEVIVGMMF